MAQYRKSTRNAGILAARWTCCLIGCILAASLALLAFPASNADDAPAEAAHAGGTGDAGDQLDAIAATSVDTVFPTWKNGAEYRAGEALVQLADGIGADEFNRCLANLSCVATSSIAQDDVALGWVKLALAPDTDVAEAAAQLEKLKCVQSAQPNFVYRLMDGADTLSQAEGPSQPELQQADSQVPTSSPQVKPSALAVTSLQTQADDDGAWYLSAIGAPAAWKTQTTNRAVTVAIVDTGCDVTHPDLKANIVASYNTLTGMKNVTDNNGHGTHVAGIISAVPNNGIGVAGVSYNAGILPIKVMEDDETDSESLVKAYQYILENAARYRIRVVNVSLGAMQTGIDVYDAATLRAIDRAYRDGILSVFAAGNEGSKAPYYCFPCDFSENGVGVINVGKNYNASASTPNNGLPNASSNYNKHLEMTKDLSAPGVNIESTYPGGAYSSKTGTSMSCPIVSGVAALVFARNPTLSASEAKSVLCSTAQDLVHRSFFGLENLGFDDYTGYGLVRADLAVAGANGLYLTGGDSLAKGSTLKLAVPDGAPSGTWQWASNRKSVATVDAATGVVRGVAHGEAAISATNGTVTLYRTVAVYETGVKGPNSLKVESSRLVSASSSPVAMWTYSSSNPKIATVGSASGLVTGKRSGRVKVTASLTACPSIKVSKTVRVTKARNPIKASANLKHVSYAQVRRHSKTVRCISLKKAKGAVTYKLAKSKSSKKLSINSKTGAITVKRGTDRGTYTAKVRVEAAGNASYKPAKKTVKVTVVIR